MYLILPASRLEGIPLLAQLLLFALLLVVLLLLRQSPKTGASSSCLIHRQSAGKTFDI